MAKRITAAALAASEATDATANPPGAMGPAVVHMDVAGMVRHPLNARTIQPTAGDTAALRESVRLAGVVQPVLVARLDDGTIGVLAGWQRVSAAQAVGRATVPAIMVEQDDAAQVRLSMLENSLRTPMHPVDAWTMIDTLMQRGSTFEAAAKILGLTQREAQQQRQLARLHRDVLEAMAQHGVPDAWDLRQIALAPQQRQREGLVAGTTRTGGKKSTSQVNWRTVANACRVERIPRARAMFGDDAGVVFTRDWLAPVGSPEEWTTDDVAGFCAAQRAWLEALVKGNDRASLVPYSEDRAGPEVPRGWIARQWLADIPREVPALTDDERFVVCMKPTGEIYARIYAVPAPAHPDAIGATAPPPDAKAPRLISDAGLQMAAQMKHQALGEALSEMSKSVPAGYDDRAEVLLRALLQALGAQNVTPGAVDKGAPGNAIAEAAPDGGEPSRDALVRIACTTLRDMLVFDAPRVLSSGPIADDIAGSLGAEAYLGPFDTPDFLAQCSGTLLREAARGVTLQPGQKLPKGVSDLRAFLVGKLPDWRPVVFVDPVRVGGSADGQG